MISIVKNHGCDIARILVDLGGSLSYRSVRDKLTELKNEMKLNAKIRDYEFMTKLKEVPRSSSSNELENSFMDQRDLHLPILDQDITLSDDVPLNIPSHPLTKEDLS